MKRTQKELMKDMWTKGFDQIYDEMSKGEKIGYWISIVLACVGIVLMFIFRNQGPG